MQLRATRLSDCKKRRPFRIFTERHVTKPVPDAPSPVWPHQTRIILLNSCGFCRLMRWITVEIVGIITC
jgi:hypothetical protein